MAKQAPPERRFLLRAEQLWSILGTGRALFFELVKANRIPKPLELEGRRFWRRAEIEAWILAGCPPPDRWKWEPVLLRTVQQAIKQDGQQLTQMRREMADAEAELIDVYAKTRAAKQRLDEINRLASSTARGGS